MTTRRTFLTTLAVGAAATVFPASLLAKASPHPTAADIEALTVKGDIRQSVSKWCFGNIPMDEFCKICKKIGMVGIDLVSPNEWEIVQKNDMIVTMSNVPGAAIPKGFNRIENHDKLIESYEALIPKAAEKKIENLICFSGNREGLDDEKGMENCIVGLKRLMSTAEKHGVNIVMELLNSKDHKDYMADTTPWAGALARKIGSERFKLLYDIYHMQRMEGDVINMIRAYKDVIGHYHTAGNPGRKDLDEHQELYYPPIVKAIKDTGYKGYVAHEFIPKDGINSLRRAVELCDV